MTCRVTRWDRAVLPSLNGPALVAATVTTSNAGVEMEALTAVTVTRSRFDMCKQSTVPNDHGYQTDSGGRSRCITGLRGRQTQRWRLPRGWILVCALFGAVNEDLAKRHHRR